VIYRIVADLLVLLHLAFICFAVAGAFLAWKWRWLALLHLPAVAWAVLISLRSWPCPLTPLEKSFRTLAGQAAYEGGFVENYIVPLIYPEELTRGLQLGIGIFVLVINIFAYGGMILRSQQRFR
jgi:hypothetical protein